MIDMTFLLVVFFVVSPRSAVERRDVAAHPKPSASSPPPEKPQRLNVLRMTRGGPWARWLVARPLGRGGVEELRTELTRLGSARPPDQPARGSPHSRAHQAVFHAISGAASAAGQQAE